MHVLGALDLDAHRLDIRPQAGKKQQQRRPVVDAELLAAAPQHHEGLADGHEAQEYAAQQDELYPRHLGEQGVQRPHGGVLRHQPVDAGRHHVGDGVAEQQEVVVQLGGDHIDRHGGGAVEPRQQRPVDGPVDVVHHDADEHIHRKAEHLPQQGEVVPVECKGHLQPCQAVGDVDHAAEHGEDQRDDGQRHGAIAHQQQGDHDQRVQHLLAHGHDLLKQIPLIDGHMALEYADGERQRGVHRQNAQQPLRQADLLRRQLLAEHHIAVGQAEADGQHRRAQDQIRYQEHAVELGAALPVARRPEPGVVPHIGTAKAEAQQVQIGYDGQHRLIDAEFAFAQPLRKVDLLRCQLLAEHHIAVGQPEADGQHQRTQDEVRYQEHTVQLGAALLVAGGTEAGVIPHIGAAQAEAQ